MKKYWLIFVLELQVQLQYRVNLVMWLLIGAMSTTVVTLVWLAILGERGDIGGFSQSDFVVYFVYMVLSWYIIGGSYARQLGGAIKKGEISKSLIKPYNVLFEELIKEQAWKVTSLVATLPAIVILLFVFRRFLVIGLVSENVLPLICSIILAILLFATIEGIVGCSAFWVTEVWPFADLNNILLNLFGGVMAPLSLLPPLISTIANYLPFKYIFYGPAMIMLGKIQNGWDIVFPQIVFIIVAQIILQLMWRTGLRKYEGNGG